MSIFQSFLSDKQIYLVIAIGVIFIIGIGYVAFKWCKNKNRIQEAQPQTQEAQPQTNMMGQPQTNMMDQSQTNMINQY